MRIRRNPSRIPSLSFRAAMQAQPKVLPSEAVVLPPSIPSSPALYADSAAAHANPVVVPLEVCFQNCAWITNSHTFNLEELNDAGVIGDAWREPRENPGLAYNNVDFVLQQQEVEEGVFLLKKKVGDKITGNQKQQQVDEKVVKVSKKLKRDGNQQKSSPKAKSMTAKKVIRKEVVTEPLACKRTDGRKWHCKNTVAVSQTLCEKHLHQSRSYYTASSGASSKSAPARARSKRARASSPPSRNEEALGISDEPASSKAAPSSKRPRKTKKVEENYSGGAFYYPEPFGPFRGKQRGNCSSSSRINRVEATTDAVEEEVIHGSRLKK